MNAESTQYHVPIMLEEVLEGLAIRPDGVYVDCTFGGGGHARGILSRLGPTGKLIAFDQDADAKANLPDDPRVLFVPQNFRHLQRFLRLYKIEAVDGLMADLGVSSHQFDAGSRGFSIRFDAPLDMRMDQRQEQTAADLIASVGEQQLHKLFEQYGEVTNAKTLAKTIVTQRAIVPMQTIHQFKTAIAAIVKGNPNKYFAQVFQALRIAVNDEMGALKALMEQIPQVLKPGGRVAIITFHSLEDRLVKQYLKFGRFDEVEDDHPFETKRSVSPFELIYKKPIVPSAAEQKRNSRSRSAKLRVAMKK
jgi:16S rRNA (cytosine1402-N4)-methyltransferase